MTEENLTSATSTMAGNDATLAIDTDTSIQEILLAASNHDLTTISSLLGEYSFSDCEPADVQDPETRFSPLHAAIAACDVLEDQNAPSVANLENTIPPHHTDPPVPEEANGLSSQEELVDGARDTVKYLLGQGAIWNQLDSNNETPGCLALRLGLKELYDLMVDAGVRAELLLARLEGYEPLEDEEEDQIENGASELTGPDSTQSSVQSSHPQVTDVNSEDYLRSALSHTPDKLLDAENNGVMMSWESSIMSRSANALLPTPGLKILNIGFGMGIIDTYIQSHTNKPAEHHIVEAHPSVLADMRTKGWAEKNGVTIHAGKWQDVLPRLVAEGHVFDGIYFDTFAEDYAQFREFFSEQVIGLLNSEDGRWSFFNGMGADRQISYDVYQKVVEIDLSESGFDVAWSNLEVPKLDKEWEGVKRKYWNVDKYRLPLCKFLD